MKISTRGRYALRLMIDIAQNSTEKPVSIKEAAKRQGISVKYLEQIISVLNNAGYVQSIRGPQGGYLLSRKPEEYTAGMVLRLTEGPLSTVACTSEDSSCERIGNCPTSILWRKLDEAVNGVVDNITLADLIKWQSGNEVNYE